MIQRQPIERLHLVDLDVVVNEGETIEVVCSELATGLLIQHSVLIDAGPGGGWPVVRFTGPRGQLDELLNRYNGVPGAFDPSPWTPPESISTIGDGAPADILDRASRS